MVASRLIVATHAEPVGRERAVEIASRRLVAIDPSFRPADHVARAFVECRISPWTIDDSRRGVGPIVARVRVDMGGSIKDAGFVAPGQHIESDRPGRLFRLSARGSVDGELNLE